MAEIIASLIDDSQQIIREDRRKTIEIAFKLVEEFLSESKIPVNSDYDEINFYKYAAYPIMNFNKFAQTVKNEIVEGSTNFRLMYFINGYIYHLVHDGYQVITFTNIFWPHENHKYSYKTYEAPARLNSDIKMQYIHPKYSLEEIYRRLYCPEYFGDLDTLHVKKNQLTQFWRSLDGESAPGVGQYSALQLNFGKYQKMFVDSVSKLFISVHYDGSVPTFIGNSTTIEQATTILKEKFTNLSVVKNSSKSFFDPRTINYMFKLDSMILGRVWQLLDQEVIPILPSDKSKAHISVAIKLALTEHITYEILGIPNLPQDKLKLFSQLLASEKELKRKGIYTKVSECKFVGTYYPLDKYLSTLRTDQVVETINNPRPS